MTLEERKIYYRKWRKAHPGYHTKWMREFRESNRALALIQATRTGHKERMYALTNAELSEVRRRCAEILREALCPR